MDHNIPTSSPDPVPSGTIYLWPGDDRTFWANGHTYDLGPDAKAREDGLPMPDGAFTAILALSVGEIYRQAQQEGKWWIWDCHQWLPSAPPVDWLPPPPPPPPVPNPWADVLIELTRLDGQCLELIAGIACLRALATKHLQ